MLVLKRFFFFFLCDFFFIFQRNQPLYPATIRQLLNAQQVTPDADDFHLNGQQLTQVCLIGQIVNSQPTQTHLNYSLDDSTGLIDVRLWVDQETSNKPPQHSAGIIFVYSRPFIG